PMKGMLGATVLALSLSANAKADLITMTGVFGPDSSYPGSILPGTQYSIAGVVDFTNDHYGTDGIGVYWLQAVTVTGAFGSIEFEDPNGRGLVFEIAEPSKSQSIGGAPNAYTIVFGRRQPGTVGLPGLNVIDSYQAATPTIDADAPVSPATFSDNVKHGSDLLALQKVGSSEILNWGAFNFAGGGLGASFSATAAPEPSAGFLLAISCLGLFSRRHRFTESNSKYQI
ncbi:MAG: PEP-CTERM sorting domain-containing protein, partial [Planctomycetales bacterium]|nr:PEP-CTERM sorting domain-containing protein [Planctomycetales bacterium]